MNAILDMLTILILMAIVVCVALMLSIKDKEKRQTIWEISMIVLLTLYCAKDICHYCNNKIESKERAKLEYVITTKNGTNDTTFIYDIKRY